MAVPPDSQPSGESPLFAVGGVAPPGVTPPPERRATAPRARAPRPSWKSLALFGSAALGVLQFTRPARPLEARPFARVVTVPSFPVVAPSASAFGRSGEVKVRFALPGEPVEYPLEVRGDRSALSYEWVRLGGSSPASAPRPLSGSGVIAPPAPGFYQLALVQGTERRVVDELTLAVLVPFRQKVGATLNGYKIGTYLAERLGGAKHDRPAGFVEVAEQDVDMAITKHLRLSDFITHDNQDVWPRYAAVRPELLDKLELVVAEIARRRGGSAPVQLSVHVHSGFRSPYYNRLVSQAAGDSRHQYGDAADVAIDANGDGRITRADCRLIVRAVEAVERAHPELVGGLGLYRQPYVHIDTRGKRVRWQG